MFQRFILTVLMLCLDMLSVHAQTIPAYRLTNWSEAGNTKFTQSHSASINVMNVGAVGDGITPDDSAIQVAIDSLAAANGGVVFLPQGMYKISKTLNLKSKVVLRGEGSNNTCLRFNLGGINNCISAYGTEGASVNLIGSHSVGTKEINITPHSFVSGDWVRIVTGDSNYLNDSWASGHVGQMAQIDSVKANKIYIHEPLRIYISATSTPHVRVIAPLYECGIEDLRIVRNDATSALTSNIIFNSVVNSWIYGVESDSCNFGHITLQKSSNIVVRGCYLRNAQSYGSGGKAYGVVLQYTSGSNLIVDNIFRKLRHSVLLQACPNGNVVAYNYSRETYWTDSYVPNDYSGDIVLHGNYPYFNLFEGNIFQNLRLDLSHGKNGKHNAFLRNRFENFGIIFTNGSADSQAIVGNEITGSGSVYVFPFTYNRGQYTLTGTGHFQYNNNKSGTILPAGTTSSFVNSLFVSSQPSFWVNSGTWPTIGGANGYNSGTIPAKFRYTNGALFTTPLGYGTALPVTLMSFDAELLNNNVVLSWQTAQELNNSHFEIFKSTDGENFNLFEMVQGSGTINALTGYRLMDLNVVTNDYVFYHLYQIDYNGDRHYLGTTNVKGSSRSNLKVYPNPFTNHFQIETLKTTRSFGWRLTNLQGATVLLSGENFESIIDTKNLPQGIYFLEVSFGNGRSELIRLVKN